MKRDRLEPKQVLIKRDLQQFQYYKFRTAPQTGLEPVTR